MKRCAVLVLALVAGLLLLPGAVASAATYPLNTTGQGTVDRSVVQAGECVVFAGSGFAPGTAVTVSDDSTSVGSATTDASGAFSRQVCFSTAARLGSHLLTGSGTDVSGGTRTVTASVTVVGLTTSRTALPRTGADLAALVAAGLLLVVGGSVALEQTRRRRA